jgi:1,5-anhydro-D-fructose reductase (1,5-anhydro-D-mannitol-forming)
MEITWGIIGCGNVTEVKSGPAFNKVSGSRLLAVMRRNEAKARDYALRHNVPVWTTDADELIRNPEINAVYIATPPSSHAEYAIRAMEAGKIVYVEKPLASSYDDCLRMTEIAGKTGQPLYVAYYRRFLPYFIKIREMLQCGSLGKLLYVKVDFHIAPRDEDFNPDSLPWRVLPEVAGGGYFYDLACHQIDLFEWYFGNVAQVEGKCFNRRGLYKAEDLVFASLVYESGLPLNAHWCFAAGNNEHTDTIKIFGTKGSLEFSTFDFSPIRLITEAGTEEFLPANPDNIQYWFIRNMVEELRDSVPVKGNSLSAMRTNRTMDKILGRS